MKDWERVESTSLSAWRDWLAGHYGQADSVWLVYRKGGEKGGAPFTVDQAIEQALCFGWIDSLPRALDAHRTQLLFSPRKPRSNWSALNKARAARMIEAGQMAAPGLAKIEAAKQDGSWTALDAVDALIVPDDLAARFEAWPGAREAWDGFPPSTRRGILEWIVNAKRPETRAKRVEETARLAAQGKRANQWPR